MLNWQEVDTTPESYPLVAVPKLSESDFCLHDEWVAPHPMAGYPQIVVAAYGTEFHMVRSEYSPFSWSEYGLTLFEYVSQDEEDMLAIVTLG